MINTILGLVVLAASIADVFYYIVLQRRINKVVEATSDAFGLADEELAKQEEKRKKLGESAFNEINKLKEKHDKLVDLFSDHIKAYHKVLGELLMNYNTTDENFELLHEEIKAGAIKRKKMGDAFFKKIGELSNEIAVLENEIQELKEKPKTKKK